MTDAQIVAEVEPRAAEANRTPQGAAHRAIAAAVAEEAGVPYEHVRALLLAPWAGVTG